jgi:predicted ATPase/class 3 adenylate cyclase
MAMTDRGELPSGTVTFLFTDLESSTRLWEEHPDAMHDALARHDEVLRHAIESHHGYVVKTTGDGFHAAFGTARDALDAALSAQLALTAETWGSTGPLRARMGLHTGEAVHRAGDYYGTSLNRAARIANSAHGDQIVLSRATEELIGDALPEGCELVALGEHRLRDLGRPEALFQLTHPDLQRNFAPLRSIDAFPGNLPLQVSSFIGREEDISRVLSALEDARVVTLTGVGGVGKTRLALQSAAEVLPDFPDGAWFVELATAENPEALVQVAATALRISAHATTPLDTRIRDSLRGKQLLLVLDNCEHLLDSATRLADGILRECPHVRILATSRESLDLDGERVVRVRSLPLPDPSTNGELAEATDAVQLFMERADSAEPDFRLGAGDLHVVAEICRRLDGIPLAIELAAARVVSMSPSEIAELLDERFRLLTGGRRTAVERHQTLRATVDWSYSLLQPTERAVFDRLGVFPASFDAAAARAVTQGDGVEDWDVRDALTSLVNKSMINTASGPANTTRYQLLETMRQYSRERLDQNGDADGRRRAHAVHYTQRADDYGETMLTGHDIRRKQSELRFELDNFRAAVTWALDSGNQGDGDLALRIAATMSGMTTGIRRAVGLIAQSDALLRQAESSTPALRANVLAGMANDALMLHGDLGTAADLARQALDQGPASMPGAVMSYTTLSFCAVVDGRSDRALEILAEGQAASRALSADNAHTEAFYQMQISRVERTSGDPRAARLHAEQAVRLAREAQYPMRLAQALANLASTSRYDDFEGARRAADEAVAAARESGLHAALASAVMCQAELAGMAGEVRKSIAFLREAAVEWSDDIASIVVVSTAARASAIFARAGELSAAAVLGGHAIAGVFSHLLPAVLDPRSYDDLHAALDQARTSLGEELFDAELARGAVMSSDEVLVFIRHAADVALTE